MMKRQPREADDRFSSSANSGVVLAPDRVEKALFDVAPSSACSGELQIAARIVG
jgi:hypothetical protein